MGTLLRDDLNALKKDIRTIRDELKLKMHLAAMDLRSEWDKIEPKAETFLHQVESATEEAAQEVKRNLLDLKKKLDAKTPPAKSS